MLIIRRNKTYSLFDLPELKSTVAKLNDGRTIRQGDIVTRGVLGDTIIYKHYGFVYGLDMDNKLLIIENNTDGVRCITLEDFMNGKTKLTIKRVPANINFEEVLKRARERVSIPYNQRTNNCEHFVNYSIYGNVNSVQTERTEILADTVLSVIETYVKKSNSSDEYKRMFKQSSDNFREKVKLPRHFTLEG